MIKGIKELTTNLPKVAETIGGASPDWLTKLDSIVKGINDMIGFYNKINKGTPPANLEANNTPKMPFSEARKLKKAEMAGEKGTTVMQQPTNEFKEILEGLIKAANTLEKIGHGNRLIGELIAEAPFTVTQVKTFLDNLYKSKYGG